MYVHFQLDNLFFSGNPLCCWLVVLSISFAYGILQVVSLFPLLQPLVAVLGWDILKGKTALRRKLMHLFWTSKSQTLRLQEYSNYRNQTDEVLLLLLNFLSYVVLCFKCMNLFTVSIGRHPARSTCVIFYAFIWILHALFRV